MTKRVELSGISGRTYDYILLGDSAFIPFQAANIVVAEFKRGRWLIHHVGQTDYLPRKDWGPVLDRIRAEAPQAELLYRLNFAHGVREAEAKDIRKLQQRSAKAA